MGEVPPAPLKTSCQPLLELEAGWGSRPALACLSPACSTDGSPGRGCQALLLGSLVSDLGNESLSQKTIPPLAWLSLVSEVSRKRKVLLSRSFMSGSCDSTDCILLGSSVHGTFQTRILEWVAVSFSKDLRENGYIFKKKTVFS